ncbi:hypothetical protein [Sphingomonas sp. BK235]|uniref:hypothetical protein n=1 Tax=Sphingomonas sp. BK235 TaxID=2512131 RepID=UPI0010EB1F0F|nr:hypothetical protein [Sphingomonas sp. BK235]TCP36075.1 hypothetical protein EV292_102666 [Sphingomonas sp. BK235]
MVGLTRTAGRVVAARRSAPIKARLLVPLSAALAYPLIVDCFHLAVGPAGMSQTLSSMLAAAILLCLMFAVPMIGFVCVLRDTGRFEPATGLEIRTRRLAYAVVAAPTLYCFVGVGGFLLSSPVNDEVTWSALWIAGAASTLLLGGSDRWSRHRSPSPLLRVAHGLSALILLAYVAFHLANHLCAWRGEQAHAAVMAAGRSVYRSPIVEPVLVTAMLFQMISGACLAWRWSAQRLDFHKSFQVASGFYLSVYILGHMNSVFVFARWKLGIPTGWAFATGAPAGLIHDAWSIRLVPHYALGVFLVIAHLFSGLRVILIAHGTKKTVAERIWWVGVVSAGGTATAIMLAMCGLRLP